MNDFLSRLFSKLYRISFYFIRAWIFQSVGVGTALFKPFRVDGGKGISIGRKTIFQRGAWLYCCGLNGSRANLIIGNGCSFGYNNHITAVGKVVIEDNVLTANNVYISDNIHDYKDITIPIMHQQVQFKKDVKIGSGSWIGENACIIGVHVGKNCVIGANAVVTNDIPDYSVAVGVPAVVIKKFDQRMKKWTLTNT